MWPKPLACVASTRSLAAFDGGEAITQEELLTLDCTVLIPAALERVITPELAPRLRCRLLAEAANGPTTYDADRWLETHRPDLEIIPDVLCNSGGVIVSYFEWLQNLQNYYWTREEVLEKLFRQLDQARDAVERQLRRYKFSRRLAGPDPRHPARRRGQDRPRPFPVSPPSGSRPVPSAAHHSAIPARKKPLPDTFAAP